MRREGRARWDLEVGKWIDNKMEAMDPDLFLQHRRNGRADVYSIYVSPLWH